MATTQYSPIRIITFVKICSGASMADAEDAYLAFVVAQTADGTRTVQVTAVNAWNDGGTFYILAMAAYPDVNTDNINTLSSSGSR